MSQPSEGQDHLDYRETDDITEVHASVLREHPEPRAGHLPIPTWLGLVSTLTLCWAASYVGMFHGGFSPSVYNENQSSPQLFEPTGGESESGPAEKTPMEIGSGVYGKCAACHMANGLGSATVPPLGGSEWVVGSEFGEKRLISILLKGISGPIQVKGQTYSAAVMPAWESLSDKEIAGVITYVRASFGNTGTEEFTPEMIKAVRKDVKSQTNAWTSDDLKKIPTDAKIEGAAPAAKPAAGAKPAEGAKPAADAGKPAEGGKPAATAAAAPAGNFDLAASIESGKGLYMQTCMACHQMTGLGLPGAFPPLAKTDFVNGDQRRFVAIALKGIAGAITVDGKTYATGMPQPDLTFPVLKDDKKLADVLNYVRNNFGNKNDAPITPEFIAKTRKEFESRTTQWTEAELLNFK